jgi:hypothetical protein
MNDDRSWFWAFNDWTPGPGHNQPRPIDLARERVEELAAAGKKWAAVKEVTDAEIARRLDDYLNQLVAEAKRLKAEAATEKAPHKAEIDQVTAAYRPLEDALAEAKLSATALIGAYLNRQREATAAARFDAADAPVADHWRA